MLLMFYQSLMGAMDLQVDLCWYSSFTIVVHWGVKTSLILSILKPFLSFSFSLPGNLRTQNCLHICYSCSIEVKVLDLVNVPSVRILSQRLLLPFHPTLFSCFSHTNG